MSWWEGPLGRLKGRFATGGTPSAEQHRTPREAGASPPPAAWSPDAWSDVPPLQRTLADPILPVAINHRFRDSLASFTDPSFLAPLSHHVDPSVGGLVDGLVSRGEPRTHGGPDLILPSPGHAKPQVQRLASRTSGADGLQTVPLEYRDRADGPLAPAEGHTATDVASPALTVPPSPASVAIHPPVQRATTTVQHQPAAEPALPVMAPEAPGSTAGPPDTPTLGLETAPALVSRLAEPPAAVGSVPSAPAVQRIRYEPVESQQRAQRVPRSDPPTDSNTKVEPAVQRAPEPQRATARPLPERPPRATTPALDTPRTTNGGQSSADTTAGVEAEDPPIPEVPTPSESAAFEIAVDHPEPHVSRLAESVPLMPAAEEPGFIEAPLVVTWNQNAPTAAPAVDEPSTSGWASAGPTAARFADASPVTTGGYGPATRMAAPIVAVQRRVADPVPSGGRSGLPVKTETASAETVAFPQPPLVVARSPVAPHPQDAFTSVTQGMSFERMFAGAGPSAATTEAADERASVQREAVEAASAAMPSVQTDLGDTAGPVATSATGPAGAEGAAGPAGNLDEMARRLYEPLAARLREELWLDRERAGLMNDA